MRAPRNATPAEKTQGSENDNIESVPMDDFSVALTKILVPVATVAGWAFDCLPKIAAGVSIAFMIFQWYHSAPMKERRRTKGKKK